MNARRKKTQEAADEVIHSGDPFICIILEHSLNDPTMCLEFQSFFDEPNIPKDVNDGGWWPMNDIESRLFALAMFMEIPKEDLE